MRVHQIEDDWGIGHLRVASRPDPSPGPGEVLLEVLA